MPPLLSQDELDGMKEEADRLQMEGQTDAAEALYARCGAQGRSVAVRHCTVAKAGAGRAGRTRAQLRRGGADSPCRALAPRRACGRAKSGAQPAVTLPDPALHMHSQADTARTRRGWDHPPMPGLPCCCSCCRCRYLRHRPADQRVWGNRAENCLRVGGDGWAGVASA